MMVLWKEYFNLLPEIFLVASSILGLALALFLKEKRHNFSFNWSIVTLLLSCIGFVAIQKNECINEFFMCSQFTYLIKILIVFVGALIIFFIKDFSVTEDTDRFEYPFLICLAIFGMLIMINASNLFSMFMGLELQNLCLYTIACLKRDSGKVTEASIKYFVFSSIASAVMIFGISIIYGIVGSLNYKDLAILLTNDIKNTAVIIGFLLVIIGLMFKISLFPFHSWLPDLYEALPSSVSIFVVSIPKLSALIALINLCFYPLTQFKDLISITLIIFSLFSMIFGALLTLKQSNFRRLLGYSAISNSGFALIGLLSFTASGVESAVIYSIIYTLSTIGIFACLLFLSNKNYNIDQIKDLKNIKFNHPIISIIIVFLLFSIASIPPFPGFFAKLYVLEEVLSKKFYFVILIAIISSIISAYYCLVAIKEITLDKSEQKTMERQRSYQDFKTGVAILVIVFLIIVFAFCPNCIQFYKNLLLY
jgi:NADH-quinone oxidoreductase subunit N